MVLMGMAVASTFDNRATANSGTSSVHWMSAVEMARLIRTKKLSAREALADHVKQIERVNPKVNAIVTLVAEMAAKSAAQAASWFAGRAQRPERNPPYLHNFWIAALS
jgi:amidase